MTWKPISTYIFKALAGLRFSRNGPYRDRKLGMNCLRQASQSSIWVYVHSNFLESNSISKEHFLSSPSRFLVSILSKKILKDCNFRILSYYFQSFNHFRQCSTISWQESCTNCTQTFSRTSLNSWWCTEICI